MRVSFLILIDNLEHQRRFALFHPGRTTPAWALQSSLLDSWWYLKALDSRCYLRWRVWWKLRRRNWLLIRGGILEHLEQVYLALVQFLEIGALQLDRWFCLINIRSRSFVHLLRSLITSADPRQFIFFSILLRGHRIVLEKAFVWPILTFMWFLSLCLWLHAKSLSTKEGLFDFLFLSSLLIGLVFHTMFRDQKVKKFHLVDQILIAIFARFLGIIKRVLIFLIRALLKLAQSISDKFFKHRLNLCRRCTTTLITALVGPQRKRSWSRWCHFYLFLLWWLLVKVWSNAYIVWLHAGLIEWQLVFTVGVVAWVLQIEVIVV